MLRQLLLLLLLLLPYDAARPLAHRTLQSIQLATLLVRSLACLLVRLIVKTKSVVRMCRPLQSEDVESH